MSTFMVELRSGKGWDKQSYRDSRYSCHFRKGGGDVNWNLVKQFNLLFYFGGACSWQQINFCLLLAHCAARIFIQIETMRTVILILEDQETIILQMNTISCEVLGLLRINTIIR